MTFQNKRSLWYISGNKDTGDIFAHPTTEIGEPHTILTDEVARLADSDIDGARRWIVVADDGEQAIEKLTIYLLKEVLTAEETAQSERG